MQRTGRDAVVITARTRARVPSAHACVHHAPSIDNQQGVALAMGQARRDESCRPIKGWHDCWHMRTHTRMPRTQENALASSNSPGADDDTDHGETLDAA